MEARHPAQGHRGSHPHEHGGTDRRIGGRPPAVGWSPGCGSCLLVTFLAKHTPKRSLPQSSANTEAAAKARIDVPGWHGCGFTPQRAGEPERGDRAVQHTQVKAAARETSRNRDGIRLPQESQHCTGAPSGVDVRRTVGAVARSLRRRRAAVGLLAAALLLALGTVPSLGEETVIVNQAFHGREIKVRAGGNIQVELEQGGATGYLWEAQGLDGEHFEVLSVHTEGQPPSDPTMTGSPLKKTWRIRATARGKSELRFLYYRPWEGPEQAADSLIVTIRIL